MLQKEPNSIDVEMFKKYLISCVVQNNVMHGQVICPLLFLYKCCRMCAYACVCMCPRKNVKAPGPSRSQTLKHLTWPFLSMPVLDLVSAHLWMHFRSSWHHVSCLENTHVHTNCLLTQCRALSYCIPNQKPQTTIHLIGYTQDQVYTSYLPSTSQWPTLKKGY